MRLNDCECGGKPDFVGYYLPENGAYRQTYAVRCPECKRMTGRFDKKGRAAKAWNSGNSEEKEGKRHEHTD